jgi:hypothetical protein
VIAAPNGDPLLFISAPGSAPPNHRADGKPVMVCHLYEATLVAPDAGIPLAAPVTDPVPGERYRLICFVNDSIVRITMITYDPAKYVVDPATLAQYAEQLLPLLYPVHATAPPSTSTQLVGLRTWLWIDPQDFRPVSASVSAANLDVTATARPIRVVWDMGDGSPAVDCGGPGTPYDPSAADAAQHTDCAHVFSHSGTYTAEVSIEWVVEWSASNGDAGVLGPVRRGVTLPLTVESRQAVITG